MAAKGSGRLLRAGQLGRAARHHDELGKRVGEGVESRRNQDTDSASVALPLAPKTLFQTSTEATEMVQEGAKAQRLPLLRVPRSLAVLFAHCIVHACSPVLPRADGQWSWGARRCWTHSRSLRESKTTSNRPSMTPSTPDLTADASSPS